MKLLPSSSSGLLTLGRTEVEEELQLTLFLFLLYFFPHSMDTALVPPQFSWVGGNIRRRDNRAINVYFGRHMGNLALFSYVHNVHPKVTYSIHMQFLLKTALLLTLPWLHSKGILDLLVSFLQMPSHPEGLLRVGFLLRRPWAGSIVEKHIS